MIRQKSYGKATIALVCLTCLLGAVVSVVVAGVSRLGSAAPKSHVLKATAEKVTSPDANDGPQDDTVSALGFDLYRRLAVRPGNLVISPLNLQVLLALTSEGARGRTREQMAATLHLPPGGAGHAALGTLVRELQQLTQVPHGDAAALPTQLQLATALWVQRGTTLEDAFTSLARDRYAAHLAQVDFTGPAGDTRQTVNRWAAAATHERICDLIPAGVSPSDTRLLLTSAIHFRGTWAIPFDSKHTALAAFHLSETEQATVPTMNLRGRLRHCRRNSLQVLELPYADGRLAMLVIVPEPSKNLAAVERSLSGKTVLQWRRELKSGEVVVSLPRFQFDWSGSLKGPLVKLGMADAFCGAADFGGISRQHDLLISNVVHRAWLAVDEQGSEAAAASAVILGRKGFLDPPVDFRADRPFLFVIYDAASGGALFVGRVADPRPGS